MIFNINMGQFFLDCHTKTFVFSLDSLDKTTISLCNPVFGEYIIVWQGFLFRITERCFPGRSFSSGDSHMTPDETKCFEIYRECVNAIHDGVLIRQVSSRDKEFHFQNWCQERLNNVGVHFEGTGRNIYPDFCLVERPEGYEIKALAYPGREKNYDANSNVPCGYHNGRTIFYIFGRYPNDTTDYRNGHQIEYPVIDLVLCHGDFLNAQRDYIHKNKHVNGFGTYGDIMIRDRKMYVVPTPFALTQGTAGLVTLIIPDDYEVPEDFQCVGELSRTEDDQLVAGYSFNLRTNEINAEMIPNPNAGLIHHFRAYRCAGQSTRHVSMNTIAALDDTTEEDDND